MKEIIIACIGAATGLIPSFLMFYIKLKKLKTENVELKRVSSYAGMMFDLQLFNDLKDSIDDAFSSTNSDRFLILSANNGKYDMNFCTAIYEQHKAMSKVMLSVGATNKYVDFKFDDKYRKMLKQIEIDDTLVLEVDKMEDSDLKRIYKSEGVTQSQVSFLLRVPMDAENDRLYYCSFATHDENGYSAEDMVILKASVFKIKSIFKQYINQ